MKTIHCKSNVILVYLFPEVFIVLTEQANHFNHSSHYLWLVFRCLCLQNTCFLSWASPLFAFDLHWLSSYGLITSLPSGERWRPTLCGSPSQVPSSQVNLSVLPLWVYLLNTPPRTGEFGEYRNLLLAWRALNSARVYMSQKHASWGLTGRGVWKLLPELGQTPKWHLDFIVPLRGQARTGLWLDSYFHSASCPS